MELGQITLNGTGENQSWLGSRHGTDAAESVTLDKTLMLATFTDGVIPSGLVVGKVTATGKYGPYSAGATDGRQVARGLLLTTQRIDLRYASYGAAQYDVAGALLWHGKVVVANLPVNNGLDTAGQTALPLIRFV